MMKTFYHTIAVLLSFPVFIILTAPAAYAYLDPGTGSMILQGILGGLAAAAVLGRLFWSRILTFLGIKKNEPDENSQESDSLTHTDKQADLTTSKAGKKTD